MKRWTGVMTVLLIALLLGFTGLSSDAGVPSQPQPVELPVVKSCAELATLLEDNLRYSDYYRGPLRVGLTGIVEDSAAESAPGMMNQAAESKADYSETNVQVEGVDEADIVKTDGEYIYQVSRQRVVVIRANPAHQMSVQKVITFADESFRPRELYVDGEHLVVIGMSHAYRNPTGDRVPRIHPAGGTTKAVIYDIRDKNHISQLREVEVEGQYLTSRKIDKDLYLVANKYPDYYLLREPGAAERESLRPVYRDTAAGDGYQRIRCADICYFPDFAVPNYLLVASFNLDSGRQMELGAYLGAGENVYASPNNLYVAATKLYRGRVVPLPGPVPEPDRATVTNRVRAEVMPPLRPVPQEETTVYRFALDNARLVFSGQGEVPGTVLNQFSMDEYNGHFRVATTVGPRAGGESRNSLYVLNDKLEIAGKIEDIAPGERIYSARFMGDRGYMVTFKTTDPLFAFDLSDPANPMILGALKIPGFSNYLHPYDENHLIGFGKDAVEAVQKNPDGTVNRLGFAWEQGMKIALFDVTDVRNPVEKYSVRIGDRGTHSEVLDNHKALLFDREKELLAFPITVTEIAHKDPSAPWEYGAFAFQGAYVYDLSLENGFILRERLTHHTSEDALKSGQDWYPNERDIKRILYINDNLYTLSDGMVKSGARHLTY